VKFEFTLGRIAQLVALVLTALFVLLSCGTFKNPVDYSVPAIIRYTISGGIAGIHEETTIDEYGLAKLSYRCSHRTFVVHYQLAKAQWDSLKTAFGKADFFNLKDEYIPSERIADGFFYSITYTTGKKTKTIIAASGADFPKGLENLIGLLHQTNWLILSNPDAATLMIRWEYTIKEWPFSDSFKLEDNLENYAYNDGSEVFKAISNFFAELRQNNVKTLFWEDKYLYEIIVGWAAAKALDYFYVMKQYPVRYWPQDFGFDLSQIPEMGIVLEGEILTAVTNLLKKDVTSFNIFVLDELRDGGKAVSLILVSGRPELSRL